MPTGFLEPEVNFFPFFLAVSAGLPVLFERTTSYGKGTLFGPAELGRVWWRLAGPPVAVAGQPRKGLVALTEVPGSLRLFAQPLPEGAANLWAVGALLLQKPPAETFQVSTEVRFEPGQVGERTGLMVFDTDYAWIGVEQTAAGRTVVIKTVLGARDGGGERVVASVPAPEGSVQLRVEWNSGGRCRFGVSFDGQSFTTFKPAFTARPGRWVGAKVGLLAATAAGRAVRTPVDFDWFRVGFDERRRETGPGSKD